MPISRVLPAACALVLAGLGSAAALEVAPRPLAAAPAAAAAAGVKFGSAADAVRSGVRNYNAGDKLGAARALEYAATQGHALALWKLGRMYANGDGVPHDDLKAFEYFSKIADDNADESPDSPNAPVVASAFVALGTYFLDGIKNSYVKADAGRAREMYHYAASYFGDSSAQYNLARLYLDGNGVDQDVRQAARWFNLAAEKGHHPSQALLGHLLVTGQGVPRQRARGLMWLTLAREGIDPANERWIAELYDTAFAAAADGERQAALGYLEQHMRKRR